MRAFSRRREFTSVCPSSLLVFFTNKSKTTSTNGRREFTSKTWIHVACFFTTDRRGFTSTIWREFTSMQIHNTGASVAVMMQPVGRRRVITSRVTCQWQMFSPRKFFWRRPARSVAVEPQSWRSLVPFTTNMPPYTAIVTVGRGCPVTSYQFPSKDLHDEWFGMVERARHFGSGKCSLWEARPSSKTIVKITLRFLGSTEEA